MNDETKLKNGKWDKKEITVTMSVADALVLFGFTGNCSAKDAEACLHDVFGVSFDTEDIGCELYKSLKKIVEDNTKMKSLI